MEKYGSRVFPGDTQQSGASAVGANALEKQPLLVRDEYGNCRQGRDCPIRTQKTIGNAIQGIIVRGLVFLGMFEVILANDVLEHIPNLVDAMTNCKELLKVGGQMRIHVPYDMSLGAWQDPTHVRAFNENSWKYYTEWHWYLGWPDRFELTTLEMRLSKVGEALELPQDEIIRTPRAVDSMYVVLTKVKP